MCFIAANYVFRESERLCRYDYKTEQIIQKSGGAFFGVNDAFAGCVQRECPRA